MTPEFAAVSTGLCLLPLAAGGKLLFNRIRIDRQLASRFIALHRPTRAMVVEEIPEKENLRSIAIRIVSVVGDWVLRLGLLSGRTRNDVEATLRGAGHSGTAALHLFIGTKILLLALLPVGCWLGAEALGTTQTTQIIAAAIAVISSMVGPDMVLGRLHSAYIQRIQTELPDALDMMVICAQAGLGLGTTIVRVAHELRHSHRTIALEMAHTANELQVMTDGKTPLLNLAGRCGTESVRRLAATLLQSAQYGTPLTEALRDLAAELRTELITRLEARAARMSVLLTLPMVAFNLPCVFLVVGGPAIVKVIHAFS